MINLSNGKMQLSRVHYLANAWKKIVPEKLKETYDIFKYDSIRAGEQRDAMLTKNQEASAKKPSRLELDNREFMKNAIQLLSGGALIKALEPMQNKEFSRKNGPGNYWQVSSQLVPSKTLKDLKWEQRMVERFHSSLEKLMEQEYAKHRNDRNYSAKEFIDSAKANLNNMAVKHFTEQNKTIPYELRLFLKQLEHKGLTPLEKLALLRTFAETLTFDMMSKDLYPQEIRKWGDSVFSAIREINTRSEEQFILHMEKLINEKIDQFIRISNKYWSPKQKEANIKNPNSSFAINLIQPKLDMGENGQALANKILEYLNKSYGVSLTHKHISGVQEKSSDFYRVNSTMWNESEQVRKQELEDFGLHEAQVTGVYINETTKQASYLEITGTWGAHYGNKGKYLIDVRDLPHIVTDMRGIKGMDILRVDP